MNIIEAAKAMKEGKRVKRMNPYFGLDASSLRKGYGSGFVIYEDDQEAYFRVDDILADDWEVVEE